MSRLLVARPALSSLLSLQRGAPVEPISTKGLHPLVEPFARSTSGGTVLGLLRWPLGKDQSEVVVRTQAQVAGEDISTASLNLQPLGTLAQFARRAAIEADANGADESLIRAASAACVEAGGKAYEAGEYARSKLKLSQFILLNAGTAFPDVWAELARYQLERGNETTALVAAERGSASNPGWGCCLWEQAKLMDLLGRAEERRDLALAALETPYWTLNAPLPEVMRAANLEHIGDLRALMRAQEDALRTQQMAPPRSARELALLEAMGLLDETVRRDGRWDACRPLVASALERGAFESDAAVAWGDGEGGRAPAEAAAKAAAEAAAEPAGEVAAGEAAAGDDAALPALVRVGNDAPVRFVSCSYCRKPLKIPLMCSGCECVSYCGPSCQASDRAHATVCADFGRYRSRDVRVSLGDAPWVAAAMDHQADVSYCAVLEQMGSERGWNLQSRAAAESALRPPSATPDALLVPALAGVHQDEAYRLLCGCAGPPTPHRHLIEPLEGSPPIAAPPVSWASYYEARGLPSSSPLATLLTFPLTLFHILETLELSKSIRPLCVHCAGALPHGSARRGLPFSSVAARPTPAVAACPVRGSAHGLTSAAPPPVTPAQISDRRRSSPCCLYSASWQC